MSEVSIRKLEVHEAIEGMVEGGMTKEQAHGRMRDAMKAFNCDHEWKQDSPYAMTCHKCNCSKVENVVAYMDWLMGKGQ